MAREYGKPVRFRRCPRNGSRVEPRIGRNLRRPLRNAREGDAGGTPRGPLESPETGLPDESSIAEGERPGLRRSRPPTTPPPAAGQQLSLRACMGVPIEASIFVASFRFAGIGLSSAVIAPCRRPRPSAGLADEELVVTATRLPMPEDEVLASTIVIDRDAIELSGASDPGDILRFHAGLDLGRNGGPGQTTAIFIRGANSNQTLVMVDGVRINPGTIGLGALQNIAPSTIERIEVVKGPRSALWGTDAIGGVINVITRREASDQWTAEAGYGAYDTEQASLNGGLALGRAQLGLGVAWIDSQGFPTRSDDSVDRGYHNLSGTATLRGEVGPADVALSYWRAAGKTEYSDFSLAPVDQDFADSTAVAPGRRPARRHAARELRREPFRRQHRPEPVHGLPAHASRHARRGSSTGASRRRPGAPARW